ncbi:MAG: hypothetical protein AAB692_00260 [Patescibacteria group bacterium]
MSTVYFLISSSAAAASIAAAASAEYAMKRGLTYEAMHATVWTLAILAIGRVWHTFREILFEGVEWAEMVDYLFFIIAYTVFIFLTVRAKRAVGPNNAGH